MKKNNLFKAIMISFFVFVILSWIIPIGSYSTGEYVKAATDPVGLMGLLYYPAVTIGTFIQYGVVFLVIGGLYGVLDKTGVYKKLINKICQKFAGKEKRFLIITIIALAVLASLTGIPLALFVLVPLLMGIVLEMGYSKIIALVSTVGAILFGQVGATYGLNTAGHINSALSLGVNNVLPARLLILAVTVFLLVMFVLNATKKGEHKVEKAAKGKSKEKTIEAKSETIVIPFVETEEKPKKKLLPMIMLGSLLFVVLLVSMYNWNYILKVSFFENIFEAINNFTIKDYPIFANILQVESPFGYWDSYEMIGMLILFSGLIGWIYNLKLDEIIEGFTTGAKKMLKPAFLVTMANIIFLMMIYNTTGSIVPTIEHALLSGASSFNVFIVTVISMIGSLFYNNFYYLTTAIVTPLTAVYTDTAVYPVMGILITSIHSLMMIILPTSFIMIAGLGMLDISFKEWIKFIWKFVLQIFLVVMLISIILFMIV